MTAPKVLGVEMSGSGRLLEFAYIFLMGFGVGMLITILATEHGRRIGELDAAAEGARAMLIRCTAIQGGEKGGEK